MIRAENMQCLCWQQQPGRVVRFGEQQFSRTRSERGRTAFLRCSTVCPFCSLSPVHSECSGCTYCIDCMHCMFCVLRSQRWQRSARRAAGRRTSSWTAAWRSGTVRFCCWKQTDSWTPRTERSPTTDLPTGIEGAVWTFWSSTLSGTCSFALMELLYTTTSFNLNSECSQWITWFICLRAANSIASAELSAAAASAMQKSLPLTNCLRKVLLSNFEDFYLQSFYQLLHLEILNEFTWLWIQW